MDWNQQKRVYLIHESRSHGLESTKRGLLGPWKRILKTTNYLKKAVNDLTPKKRGRIAIIFIEFKYESPLKLQSEEPEKMKNVLVLGGTRFFGRKLVELLLEDGHHVAIITRGQSGNPFGDQVEHLVIPMKFGWETVQTLRMQKENDKLKPFYFNKQRSLSSPFVFPS